uniref:Uncharacterized protein n=1 Tax=Candidatus Kentrum sp. DK TaxID=2126562 RepID=A0A450T523_9GAMM|nr:MAG: hypothetical protein BECKDK2373B_GA0170837_11023 [Candidatus Kentron sp. DK]
MKDCPVCGRPGLVAGMDHCPQCGADLECFSLLDGLHESGGKKFGYRSARDSAVPSGLAWLLSGASLAILIGLVLLGIHFGMRMEQLMDRVEARMERVTEQLIALASDAPDPLPREAPPQPQANIPPSPPSLPPPSPWADVSPAPWETTISEAPLPVARADVTPPIPLAPISRTNTGERSKPAFDGYGDWPAKPPVSAITVQDTAWAPDHITPREEKTPSKQTQRLAAANWGGTDTGGERAGPESEFTDSEFAKRIADFDRRRDIARQRLNAALAKYNARDLALGNQDDYR